MTRPNGLQRNAISQGVHKMVVNGVNLTIVSRNSMAKQTLNNEDFRPLGGGKYLYTASFGREKLYKAAGYDLNKIDFAVPQSWLNEPANHKRFYGGRDRAVWSYESKNNRFGGGPVWDTEAWRKLKAIVKRRTATTRR